MCNKSRLVASFHSSYLYVTCYPLFLFLPSLTHSHSCILCVSDSLTHTLTLLSYSASLVSFPCMRSLSSVLDSSTPTHRISSLFLSHYFLPASLFPLIFSSTLQYSAANDSISQHMPVAAPLYLEVN